MHIESLHPENEIRKQSYDTFLKHFATVFRVTNAIDKIASNSAKQRITRSLKREKSISKFSKTSNKPAEIDRLIDDAWKLQLMALNRDF
jgi:hypothetical protein